MGRDEESVPMKRIQSIITTSQLGEVVIDFVVRLSEVQINEKLQKVTEKLPQILRLVTTNIPNKTEVFGQINSIFSDKVKNRFNF